MSLKPYTLGLLQIELDKIKTNNKYLILLSLKDNERIMLKDIKDLIDQ